MNASQYSVLTYIGLLLTVAPALYAWFLCGTIDSWPRWGCLVAGLIVGVAVTYLRYMRKVKEDDKRVAEHFAKHGAGDATPPVPARPTSGRLMSLLYGLGPTCWFLSVALLGNRLLDTSEVSQHEVTLLRVEDRYKGQDLIHLSSWRKGEKRLVLTKEPMSMGNIHMGVPAGTPVVVQTKPGAFGWEWLVRIDPKQPQ